jgi:hypothetical protein
MFKTRHYREKAAQQGRRAKTNNVPGQMREFETMEPKFNALANNEAWLADNFDKTLQVPADAPA